MSTWMTLTCEQCGQEFTKPHHRGPVPKYCRAACRQRAYQRRQRATMLDLLRHAVDLCDHLEPTCKLCQQIEEVLGDE